MPNEANTRTSGEPWLAVPEWRDNRIASQALAGLRLHWLFALGLAALGAPVLVFALPGELEKGNYAALLALIFPLAALCFLVSALRKTLEWRRFGRLALVMDPFPGSLGGDVGGSLELPLRYGPDHRFEATLACCRVYEKDTGESTETREEVIWDRPGLVRAGPSLDGTRLAFRFTPPSDLPESEPKSADYTRWSLHLRAALPGPDLDRVFVIPVFRSGGQTARRNLPDSHGALLAEPPPTLPRGLVRLERDPYGLTLTYPALRNLGTTLGLGFFAAIFVGTSIFITRAIRWPEFDADDWFWTLFDLLFALVPLVMSVVFWLFAIGLTIATLYMLGNALEVRVTPEEIVSRRRLFGIPLPPRRLATAEIAALETEAPLRAGPATKQIKYRSLVAKGPGRRKLALAEGIRDPALLAHLRRSIVRAGRLKLPG